MKLESRLLLLPARDADAHPSEARLEGLDRTREATSAPNVITFSNQGGSGSVYTVDLGSALKDINKVGRTQLRIYFTLDDNDDRSNNYGGFYSANNVNASRHPRLIVTYQEAET